MMFLFARQRDLPDTIPGIGPMAAAAIIAEIGTAPGEYLATAAHLASWAGLYPRNHESPGKRKHARPARPLAACRMLARPTRLAPSVS